MKKPVVVWIVQAVLVIDVLLYGSQAISSLLDMFRGQLPIAAALGGLLIGVSVSSLAAWLFVKTMEQRVIGRRLVYFLWGVLFIYPISNGLSSAGLFPPRPYIPNNQLAGAAFAEGFRYIGLLVVIVWLSFSKSAAGYLAAKTIRDQSNEELRRVPPQI
jgi:hypothetical protein